MSSAGPSSSRLSAALSDPPAAFAPRAPSPIEAFPVPPPDFAIEDNDGPELPDRFYQTLELTRAAAATSRQYDSAKTRTDLISEFKRVFDDKAPYDWQVDVTEAIVLGLDCIVIAGTGAGKTMPFMMPLLADKTGRGIVIIVSPLSELEKDQVRTFFMHICVLKMTKNLATGGPLP